jgi:undecaprenyl diphosphate synthase
MDTLPPRHVAFIMDGNRRWAKKNKLSLFLGHETGAKRLEPIVEHALKKGITYLTFWAFSTENWQRTDSEVTDLLNVLRNSLRDPMIKRLQEKKVKIQVIGNLDPFPEDIKQDVKNILKSSSHNEQMTVNIALNYGGRAEILRGINQLLQDKKETITEEEFSTLLYTKGQPDPDFIIRTGGEIRLSGYLPWQSVYSELYFADTLWPDFNTKAFDEALKDYSNRQRRFGK